MMLLDRCALLGDDYALYDVDKDDDPYDGAIDDDDGDVHVGSGNTSCGHYYDSDGR